MNIVFLIPGFSDGGAQLQCQLLAESLSKIQGVNVSVVYFYEGVKYRPLDGVNMKLLSTGSMYDPRNIARVIDALHGLSPDILFTWLHSSDFYGFFIKRKFPNIKWVMAERDSHYPVDIRYLARRVLGSHADLIIANSEAGRAYWQRGAFQNENVEVIPNILRKLTPDLEFRLAGDPVVVYAGRLEPQKNVINMAHGFCAASKLYPDAKFFILGIGSLTDKLAQIISASGCSKSVQLLGFKPNAISYFSACDIFINPSLHEGVPNTVLENMQLNKIMILSNIPEHRALVGDQHQFYLDKSISAESITSVLGSAIDYFRGGGRASMSSYASGVLSGMLSSKITSEYISKFKKVIE